MFVTPSHQFPTTVTMPLERKLALLELTKSNGQFVIEDDYEADVSFNLTPPRALKSLDCWGNVIYFGSLSKSLLPGLRIGYLVADREFIAEARALRHHILRHPPVNNQRSVALFLQRGYFDRFVAKLTSIYKQRCEVMHDSLEHHFPGASVKPEYGGAIIWLRLPEGADARQTLANWDSASLVRGKDWHGHFEHEPMPVHDFDPVAVEFHRYAEDRHRRILYQGTDRSEHRT